jgi:hypothetical protein
MLPGGAAREEEGGEMSSEAFEKEEEEEEEKVEEEVEVMEEDEGEGETSMNTTGTLLFGQSKPRGRGLSLGPTRDLTRPP